MADRQGQSVGCIIRTRNGLQFQQPFRHIHHLAFFRLSVTGYGQLDLGGRVLIEWNSAVLRCAEDHASAVSYGNAGGKIGIKNSSSTAIASGLSCPINDSMSQLI